MNMEDSVNSNPVPPLTGKADDKKGMNTLVAVLSVVAAVATTVLKVLTEIKGEK